MPVLVSASAMVFRVSPVLAPGVPLVPDRA